MKPELPFTMRAQFNSLIPTIQTKKIVSYYLGVSHRLNTLVVCHCFTEDEITVRIISARKADKDEANVYWSYRK